MRIAFFITITAIVLSSCGKKDVEENSSINNVEYFGFAVTDCGMDKLDEIDNYVNLVDMCLYDFGNIYDRLAHNTEGDNSAIIHLQGIFFDTVEDASSPTGVRYVLFSDYRERFNQWIENNGDLLINKIAAFTIADEPAWNKLNMSSLAIVSDAVKEMFPSIPILVIESSESIDGLTITENIDWIGIDRYGTLDPNTDQKYLAAMKVLKGKIINDDQKIVVIMETQWLPYYSDEGYDQSILISMSENYYEYAKNEPNVIAVIGYLLPGNFDVNGQKGFLDLDENVKDKIKAIGLDIINK